MIRVPNVEVEGKTNREVATSCIAQMLGIPEAKVVGNLDLGAKSLDISKVVCSKTRQIISFSEPMTVGDLLAQL